MSDYAVNKQTRLRALRRQITRVERRAARLRRASQTYSWIRITVVVGGLLGAVAAFHTIGAWMMLFWLVSVGLLFFVVAALHRDTEETIQRYQHWIRIKSAHLARATLDWDRIPASFGFPARTEHPFEADLDITGPKSLFRLLDTASSLDGSRRLRNWLTDPVPNPEASRQRQALVRELRPRSLFRDRLELHAAVGADLQRSWGSQELLEWLRDSGDPSLRRWLWLLGALSLVDIVLFVASQLGLVAPWWQIAFVLYLALAFARSSALTDVWTDAVELHQSLRQLQAVFGRLESFGYGNAPQLRRLAEPFLEANMRPSSILARVNRTLAAIGLRANLISWFVLNAIVPWDHFFAQRLSRHRSVLSRYAPIWLDRWFELQALCSMANFGYLNPEYTFPEILERGPSGPFPFQALGLGHPLIPDDLRVCNDFAFASLGEVSLITGSNMAGKSVFLKTVGVNCCLANAGAPVNAQALRTVTFRMYTSMRVSDSVTDGISFFYAEVKRLKALLNELERNEPLPLLFFIDEIFRGTNNRERLSGSRSYVRALAGKHGVGLIATHDLELAKLADGMSQVNNYHFRDHVAEGRMVFDFRLQPGPCPTTNALTIMALEGLPVDDSG
jgi:hypothetical protein